MLYYWILILQFCALHFLTENCIFVGVFWWEKDVGFICLFIFSEQGTLKVYGEMKSSFSSLHYFLVLFLQQFPSLDFFFPLTSLWKLFWIYTLPFEVRKCFPSVWGLYIYISANSCAHDCEISFATAVEISNTASLTRFLIQKEKCCYLMNQ